MWRLPFLLLCCTLALQAALAQPGVRIAIIIDDLGHNLAAGEQSLALPGAVTYAVLPQLAYSAEIAHRAHASGREVMLHLPMQARDGRAPGPGALTQAMDRLEFGRTLRAGLASVPHVAGVNNHMGSLLTGDPGAMRWLMEDLACHDRLYFIDSRTDVRTVAGRLAREAGLRHAERDVFLDHVQDEAEIETQFRRLLALARRNGSAIGIGHPYPETLAVLERELPLLAAAGIELVPASRLVEQERSQRLWHASSSPWPTVARNSRP
jgi:polysaccharide deacetylase 2 family uncharacterized protein YibQ